jgi:phosphoserine phosphatase
MMSTVFLSKDLDFRKLEKPSIVICISQERLLSKLKKFEPKAVVMDWDGTITVVNEKFHTSWEEMRKELSEKHNEQLTSLYERHKKGELDIVKWSQKVIDVWRDGGLTKERIIKRAGSVPLRKGAEELFSLIETRGLEPIIISHGIHESIEGRPEIKKYRPAVYACKIEFDGDKPVTVLPEELRDKEETMRAIMEKHGMRHSNIITVSDSRYDRGLFEIGRYGGLSIYLHHGGYDETHADHGLDLATIPEGLDFIIVDETLHSLTYLIRKILNKETFF